MIVSRVGRVVPYSTLTIKECLHSITKHTVTISVCKALLQGEGVLVALAEIAGVTKVLALESPNFDSEALFNSQSRWVDYPNALRKVYYAD